MRFALHYKEIGRKYIVDVVSLLFVLLFIYAAVSKLLDFETFTVQLAQSPLLSAYAGFIAYLVPTAEIGIAILLMVGRYRTLGLYASYLLMVMFTTYIFIILNFSDFIPCSCGGVLEKLSWTQHFIFNIVFILLAGVAVFLFLQKKPKKTFLILATLAFFGIGIVTLLFAFSEKEMHRNNAFVRRYIPHPTSVLEMYDLKYNSWYMAGINSGNVYLGNVTAPLKVLILDTLLRQADTIEIQLDNMHLPYKSVTIAIGNTDFFVSDGTVPIILHGSKTDWRANTFYKNLYFTAATPMDSLRLSIRLANARTLKNSIAVIKNADAVENNTISGYELPALVDGIFESDGLLLWNEQLQKIVYTYFYSNRYYIIAPSLETVEQHTIDTVTTPALEILSSKNLGRDKLKGNATIINQYAATYGDYLYIKSKRLGKNEPKDMLEEASIIDVYNITTDEYMFSFYLYHQGDKKLTTFYVVKNTLYAIMEDRLVKYHLDNKFFNPI
ncbi:hypothetical protein K8089_10165 [Aequorivita sp. F47161]|uniref:Methylamine utilisation protein MauE domain-containing protein n=1 Tax=Aequorivita vitellina TaxID=2874475 RepID=A0A9X1U3B2_9FLAO|nr:MauE/DoxX family redox-associated membrane protein [Aequorivita vitellina]MCG2419388.1 hypothetical protein [Aequorivita vitellina]